METFQQFLLYLREPSGVTAAVGIVMAIIAEYQPTFQSLQPKFKRLWFFGLCMAVPIIAAIITAIIGYCTVCDWNELFWPALVAGATAFAAGQVAHTKVLSGSD